MISVIALIISIGGLVVTFWATRISKKALDHAINVQERSELKEFERIRAELMNQVSDSRATLERTRIEIGTLQADFKSEPAGVQALMAKYASLFSEYLPKLEEAIRECDKLWGRVSGWATDRAHSELMQARAALYRSLKDDEVVQESATYLVKIFKERLAAVKRRVGSG